MSDSQEKHQSGIPAFVNWVLRFYITLAIPFLLVVGSARVVMTEDFLKFEYNRPNFSVDSYGFSAYDRLNYGPYGILYIVNNEPIAYLADLELPGALCYPPQDTPCPAFDSGELSHMEDVQVVAQGLFRAGFLIGLLSIVIGFVLLRFVSKNALRLALMQGSLLTIGLVIAIILLAVTAWDEFFSGFHSLFFEDGTWQFFYSDTLIRLYPEQFWFDAALVVGIMTTAGAIVILAIAWQLQSTSAQKVVHESTD